MYNPLSALQIKSVSLLTLGLGRFLSKDAHWKLERESIENQDEADTPDLTEALERTDLVDPQLETERPDATE